MENNVKKYYTVTKNHIFKGIFNELGKCTTYTVWSLLKSHKMYTEKKE